MEGYKVKKELEENMRMIRGLVDPTDFRLNGTVHNLIRRNMELQNECEHEFRNGQCIWCWKEKKV